MGISFSKVKKSQESQEYKDLHIITFNNNLSSYSSYNNNILYNFINNFKQKNCIICIQGLRYDITEIIENKDIDNYYYSKQLGLLIYSNLKLISNKIKIFDLKKYKILNQNKYGFQILNLDFCNINLAVYNLELIPDIISSIDFDQLRQDQVVELIQYICKNKNYKYNIVTGCFYEYKNINFEELINIAQINNIITNLETGTQQSYIFLYSQKLANKISNLNKYLKDKLNIEVINHKIYNLQISEHCPFETILRIKDIKN